MYTKLFFIGLIILVIFLIYLNYETTKKLNNLAIEFNKIKSENDLLQKSNMQLQYTPNNDSNSNINFTCNNDFCHINSYEPNKINTNTNINNDNFILNNNTNVNLNKNYDSEFNVILNDLDDNNEYESESEIKKPNINSESDSESDSESELIFNTGNSLCYTTKVDTETKKILQTLKNDITDTETIKFATEDINSKTNPFASTIVSCLLNNMLNKQQTDTPVNSIENNNLDIFNNINNDNESLIESLSNKALDENQVQISIDQCNNIEKEINKLNDNIQNELNNGILIEPIKENKNTYTYDKLNKLKIDEIKLLCISKNIKLSVNKKQKKKDELIKELLTLK